MVLKFLWIKILFIKLTNSYKHSLMLKKSGIEVHLMHEFMPLELFLVFLTTNMPNPLLQVQNSCFRRFCAITSMHTTCCEKLVSTCIRLNVSEQQDSRHTTWKILMHSFRSKTHILGIFTPFRCSTTSIWFRTTYFMSKTRVSGGSCYFVAAPDPL